MNHSKLPSHVNIVLAICTNIHADTRYTYKLSQPGQFCTYSSKMALLSVVCLALALSVVSADDVLVPPTAQGTAVIPIPKVKEIMKKKAEICAKELGLNAGNII